MRYRVTSNAAGARGVPGGDSARVDQMTWSRSTVPIATRDGDSSSVASALTWLRVLVAHVVSRIPTVSTTDSGGGGKNARPRCLLALTSVRKLATTAFCGLDAGEGWVPAESARLSSYTGPVVGEMR